MERTAFAVRARCGIAGLCLLLLGAQPSGSRADDNALRIEPTVRWDVRHPTKLSFEIVSMASRPVELNEASLPWGNHYALILEAVTLPSGVSLEKLWPIDDPMDATLQFRPGTHLTGDVDLVGRFKDAQSVMGRKDVILFWSFQVRAKEGTFERVGGWLLASAHN